MTELTLDMVQNHFFDVIYLSTSISFVEKAKGK